MPLPDIRSSLLKSLQENDTISLQLKLVPVRTGSLSIPTIIIRPLPNVGEGLSFLPTAETHHANAAMRVEVIPVAPRQTFWVPLPEYRRSVLV